MKRKRTGADGCTAKKGKMSVVQVASWNVNGLRASIRKGAIQRLLSGHRPNIVCLQETKIQRKHVDVVSAAVGEGYFGYWNCCEGKKGTAGVGILTDTRPVQVRYDLDNSEQGGEGRVITAEFPSWYVVTVYFPQPGDKFAKLSEKLAWEQRFKTMVATLQANKPVICLGDFNIIMDEKDCPKKHIPKLGNYFDKAEIDSFQSTIGSLGMIDTFRSFHPEAVEYSYFSALSKNAREKQHGWRLDYIFVSASLHSSVLSSTILADSPGSDHLPVLAVLTHS